MVDSMAKFAVIMHLTIILKPTACDLIWQTLKRLSLDITAPKYILYMTRINKNLKSE